jgi:hypothetical protein
MSKLCLQAFRSHRPGSGWICVGLLLATLLLASSCASPSSGSRDFVPGKGWVPND